MFGIAILSIAMAVVDTADADGYNFRELENKLVHDYENTKINQEVVDPLLPIVKEQQNLIWEMDKKVNLLMYKVSQQGKEIEDMKETIQKQETEIGQLNYERNIINKTLNRQGMRIKEMEGDLRKQSEIIDKLQTENEIHKMKTEIGKGNENKHNGLEAIAANHYMKWNGADFYKYRDRNVDNDDTSARNGKTNMLDKERQSFAVREKNISDASVMKRLLSPVSQTRVAFSAYLSYTVNHMGIGHTIKPDKVYLNDGNSYSTHTGVFNVPTSGIYLLTFTIDGYYVNHATEVGLVVDSVNMGTAKAEAGGSNHYVQATKVLILHLNAGQSVWLQTFFKSDASIYSNANARFVTFSGVLLY